MEKIIRGIDESMPKEAIKHWPTTMTTEPNVQSGRDPSRSESQPATDATMTMTTELATMSQGRQRDQQCALIETGDELADADIQ